LYVSFFPQLCQEKFFIFLYKHNFISEKAKKARNEKKSVFIHNLFIIYIFIIFFIFIFIYICIYIFII